MKVEVKKRFSLKTADFLKGLLVAVVAAIIPIIQGSLSEGSLSFDWQLIATVGLSALIAYLAKKLLEPTKVQATAFNGPDASKLIAGLPQQDDGDDQYPHPPSNPFYPKKK